MVLNVSIRVKQDRENGLDSDFGLYFHSISTDSVSKAVIPGAELADKMGIGSMNVDKLGALYNLPGHCNHKYLQNV